MHDFYLVWQVLEGMDGWGKEGARELKGPGHPIPPALFPGMGGDALSALINQMVHN